MKKGCILLFAAFFFLSLYFVSGEPPGSVNIQNFEGLSIPNPFFGLKGEWIAMLIDVEDENPNKINQLKEEYIQIKKECGLLNDFLDDKQINVSEKCAPYEKYGNAGYNIPISFQDYIYEKYPYPEITAYMDHEDYSTSKDKIVFAFPEGFFNNVRTRNYILVIDKMDSKEVYFSDTYTIYFNGPLTNSGINETRLDKENNKIIINPNESNNIVLYSLIGLAILIIIIFLIFIIRKKFLKSNIN